MKGNSKMNIILWSHSVFVMALFQIEKMVADEALKGAEQADARTRMAVSLGAAPPKGPLVPYKQLKQERAEKKAAKALQHLNNFSKNSMKKGKGKKKAKKAT